MEETDGMTLMELWSLVRRNLRIVLVCMFAGLVLGIAVVFVNMTQTVTSPTYTASMSLAVVSENNSGGFGHSYETPGQEDVTAARNMTQTAAYICEGDQVIDAAIKKMGLIGVDSQDVAQGLKAEAMKDSQIIELTLQWDDPGEAVQILSAIADVVPGVLIDTLKLGNASVVDSPKIKAGGVGLSKQAMYLLVGILAGAFVAIALLVLKDMLKPTVVDPSLVRHKFGVNLAGTIPDYPQIEKTCKPVLEGTESLSELSFQESFMATAHILSHYFRSAGSRRNGALEDGLKPRMIYLTSSVEGEGKSTCAARLAIELAKEWNVLLIDCDLCNPSIAPMLVDDLDPLRSINGVIIHGAPLEDALIPVAEGLTLLPSLVEEQRLGMSRRIVELCETASKNFDVVIIDTPPIGRVSDCLALNRLVDGVLYVIRYDCATDRAIRANFEVLDQSGAKLLGAVVNRVNLRYFGEMMRYPRYSSSPDNLVTEQKRDRKKKPRRLLFRR